MNTHTRRLACLVSLLGAGCFTSTSMEPSLRGLGGELPRPPWPDLPGLPALPAPQVAVQPSPPVEAVAEQATVREIGEPVVTVPSAGAEELRRRLALAIQRMGPDEEDESSAVAVLPVHEKTLGVRSSSVLTRADPERPVTTTDVESEGLPQVEDLEPVDMSPKRIAALFGFDPSAERPITLPPTEDTQARRKVSAAASAHPLARPATGDSDPAPAAAAQAGPSVAMDAPSPRPADLSAIPADQLLARQGDGALRINPAPVAPPSVSRLLAKPVPLPAPMPPVSRTMPMLACAREGEGQAPGPEDSPCRPTANEVSRPPGPPRSVLEETQLALNSRSLEAIRGGYSGINGLQVFFGIERSVYVNGALVTTTSLNLSGQGQSVGGGQSLALIQSGAGNSVAPQLLLPSAMPGTVIQNTLNDQRIQALTVINATVNSMQVLRSLNLQTTIRESITDSLRR